MAETSNRKRESRDLGRKPDWLRVRAPSATASSRVRGLLKAQHLNTVCQEAACPNRGECWDRQHAAFMILGRACTRNCQFCNVTNGKPGAVDPEEPARLAEGIRSLGLRHVVVTSVTRDDLPDGGAGHFARCIRAIRRSSASTTIEVLTPDFREVPDAVSILVDAAPDVFNHNVETVPRLYAEVRPGARYERSLALLSAVKNAAPSIFTKSGLMVGLGESPDEVRLVMDDLRENGVDFLTIGQYLRPTRGHLPVSRYVPPAEFDAYAEDARARGFRVVSSSPLTRSSHNADIEFEGAKNSK